MRRLLALLALPVLLASCGGSSKTSAVACAQQYWNGTLGLCLPTGWSVVDRETLTQKGVSEDVVAAFQADNSVSGQFPTVSVMREPLASTMDSPTYSNASIRLVATLPAYKLIDTKKATVAGANVLVHIYTAQPLAEEPQRRFYQVSVVNGDTGYTATGLTPISINSTLEQQVELILQSLTFTDPAKAAAASSKK